MTTIAPIYVGDRAVNELLSYCQEQGLNNLVIVEDDNTHAALGQRVEAALRQNGFDVTPIILKGKEIIADEVYLTRTLVQAPARPQTYLAVGSGTLTDITRFVSHRSRNPFISLPTAPSVDGFTSIGAPLVLGGVKTTLNCQPPRALFADLPTLQAAPQAMIAAGFGDLLGKTTSIADWRLGALLWDEAFSEAVATRTEHAYRTCLTYAQAIGSRDASGIRALIEGLIDSGLAMLEFGQSHPASGSEHHAAHFWEMMLLQQHRPAILHGAKVGVASLEMARLYERIRHMSSAEARARIEQAAQPDYETEIATIRQAYGPAADGVIQTHHPFLPLSATEYATIKARAIQHWDTIRAIAEQVLSPAEISAAIKMVQGPTSGHELGFSAEEFQRGLQCGHYLRNRLTVRKLFHLFGFDA